LVGAAGLRLRHALDVSRWALQLVVVVAALVGVQLVVDLWFEIYGDLVHDRSWGLSTQTAGGWLLDVVRTVPLNVVLLSALLIPVYAVIRSTENWWLLGWGVFMVLQVVFAFLVPVVILPIFNRFTPLEAGELRTRIERIAELAGVTVEGVYVMDASRRTRRDNAFVAGFGATRRVVLFDTILEYPPESIEHVVAHEIGHYRLRHIVRSIPVIGVLMLAVFAFLDWFTGWERILDWAGVASIEDPGAVPVFLLGFALASAVVSLATAWYTRLNEREADLEALELLGEPDAMVRLWKLMGPKNKADLDPPWWSRMRHSHPELAERMAFARRWAERAG
jgi:STE24 endopeptidase